MTNTNTRDGQLYAKAAANKGISVDEYAANLRAKWAAKFDEHCDFFDKSVANLRKDIADHPEMIVDGRIEPADMAPPMMLMGIMPKGYLVEILMALSAREALRADA